MDAEPSAEWWLDAEGNDTCPCHAPMSPESCACRLAGVITDTARHTAWHTEIQPLPSADAATIERAYGRPSSPARTYVDDQFERSRA